MLLKNNIQNSNIKKRFTNKNLSTSLVIKKIFCSFLFRTNFLQYNIRKKFKESFLILTYHRIGNENDIGSRLQPGMYVSVKLFKEHIVFLKKEFNIVKLSTLFEKRKIDKLILNGKPLCILTFDDGWNDFYSNAFPLLKEFEVPATVFLPTNFIGTHKWFWTEKLAYIFQKYHHTQLLIKRINEHAIKINKKKIPIAGSIGMQFSNVVEFLKNLPENQIKKIVRELLELSNISIKSRKRQFLTWGEAKEMYLTGNISFGSHTANHYILTKLNNLEVKSELSNSKRKLFEYGLIEKGFIPFCYPNGNFSKELSENVMQLGYNAGVTTRKGWDRFDTDYFQLNRISIHQDISLTKGMLAGRILGYI